MMFASTVDFRLSLDFFDSGLYTCAAVSRLTLALAKLSCLYLCLCIYLHYEVLRSVVFVAWLVVSVLVC